MRKGFIIVCISLLLSGGIAEVATAAPDWTAESNQAYAWFGISVGTAGDVNGDGFDDVIIGASRYDNGESDEGRAYVYYGTPTGLSTTPAWTAESNQADAWFGYSVGTAGDVNNDGYDDIIVSAPLYDNGELNEGRAYIYYGSSSGLSPVADRTIEGNRNWARLGWSVGTAGDVNGDGFDDVIIGTYNYTNKVHPGAFVYHGSASGLGATPAWQAEGSQGNESLGYSVGTAGDVNGDGFDDVVVGAPHYDTVQHDEGRVYVYYGSTNGLSSTPDWMDQRTQPPTGWFGYSVGTAGDVDGNGFDDIIVGAPQYYTNINDPEGWAFVYYGSASGLSTTADWSDEGDPLSEYFEISVGTAGDVNDDGYSDIIVGEHHFNFPNGPAAEGRVYVHYGSANGLSVPADWTFESGQVGARLGISVGTAGDVNGDGVADVIAGAYQYENGEPLEGRAFVFHGPGASSSGDVSVLKKQDFVDRGGNSVYRGDSISYTTEITNFFDQAVTLLIQDAISAYVDYVGGTLEGDVSGMGITIGNSLFSSGWSYMLNPGEILTITFDVEVKYNAPIGDFIEDMVTVSYFDPIARIPVEKSESVQVRVGDIPEPATMILFSIGIVTLFTLVRRKWEQRK